MQHEMWGRGRGNRLDVRGHGLLRRLAPLRAQPTFGGGGTTAESAAAGDPDGGGLIRHAVCGVPPSQRQALLPAGARASSPRDVACEVKLPRQRARACLEPGTSIIQEKIGFPGARLLRKWETRETRGHSVPGPKGAP